MMQACKAVQILSPLVCFNHTCNYDIFVPLFLSIRPSSCILFLFIFLSHIQDWPYLHNIFTLKEVDKIKDRLFLNSIL